MTQCPKCSRDRSVSRTNHMLQRRGTLAVLEGVEVEECPSCQDSRVTIPEMDKLLSRLAPLQASTVWPARFRFADGDWRAEGVENEPAFQISDAVAAFIEQSA